MLAIHTGNGPIVGFEDSYPPSQRSNAPRALVGETGTELPINKWLGIPYAQAERWKRPASPTPWKEPLMCHEYGPHFPHGRDVVDLIFAGTPGWIDRSWIPHSEKEGFNLNVYSPEGTQEHDRLPVLVWIHGGGLLSGGGGYSFYDPTEWIRSEASQGRKFIVVTGNYRLNIFGFMFCSDLIGEDSDGLAGNYGLYDCVAYLEWVKSNIEKFGGDADNITIFGESAGGDLAGNLLTCKKPLFRRAILQSGFPGTVPVKSTEELERAYKELLIKSEVESENAAERLKKLREIPEGTLCTISQGFGFGGLSYFGLNLESTPASQFYKPDEPVLDRLRQGVWNPYIEEVLMGLCDDEGSAFANIFKTYTKAGFKMICDDVLGAVEPELLKEIYPDQPKEDEISPDENIDFRKCPGSLELSDRLFVTRFFLTLETIANKKNFETQKPLKMFLYRLNAVAYDLEAKRKWGVMHTSDIPFIFNTKAAWENHPENSKTAAQMGSSWREFAATGLPDATWPAYSDDRPLQKVFEQDGSCTTQELIISAFAKRKNEFWSKIVIR